MAIVTRVAVFVFLSVFTLALCKCPCSSPSLCEIITKVPEKEVFVFSLNNDKNKWIHYDWTKVTTVVMVGYISADLMCYAHKSGARVITIGNYPTANLTSPLSRLAWINDQLEKVITNHLDGINIDFEDAIPKDRSDLNLGYTELIMETYQKFKTHNSSLQVTVDVAWSPDCIDLRCYDYKILAEKSDFLFVMAYDEQSQIYGECVAGANCGFSKTYTGLESYLKLGISRDKLVLGIPWYGYIYSCLSVTKDNKCLIRHVPFRGVNCSDAAGTEIDYSVITTKYLPYSFSGKLWDNATLSPYFIYVKRETKDVYQIWFDDVRSLAYKYQLAENMGLRGVGVWNADSVNFSLDPEGSKNMWSALPSYKRVG